MWYKIAASMVSGLLLASASAACNRTHESERVARTGQDTNIKATCSFRITSQKWITGSVSNYQNYRRNVIMAINKEFGFKEFKDYIINFNDFGLNVLVFSKNICSDTIRIVDGIHHNEVTIIKLDEATTNKLIEQIKGEQ